VASPLHEGPTMQNNTLSLEALARVTGGVNGSLSDIVKANLDGAKCLGQFFTDGKQGRYDRYLACQQAVGS
jgi:hypothetical protein